MRASVGGKYDVLVLLPGICRSLEGRAQCHLPCTPCTYSGILFCLLPRPVRFRFTALHYPSGGILDVAVSTIGLSCL
ncbi:uncharacterized protein K489DRAFT_193125 [Dissoconium aciculare CBS 342.82]|uniref:Uncharacterized protein n=1 Tax=Dissoconium aciculare CBS 342.82 TaxID=1314786 RepID=A0A6J3M622_9PEZI|nr:uncharacterized protein K489DRAFT_193125 [Dissoconium aciculare CBS 342.82]KAF1823333.1 hypothetical protein K489DRAFT_193125 [Dissoconium aciculare CBS 342.82]